MLKARKIKTEYRQTASVVNALNIIWHNTHRSLDLAGIARACNVSKFHFHRLFHEHQGETLSSYVSRKRLELVARRLVWYPNLSISEVAMSHGFSSPANFSKSFKNHFGITAKDYRHPNLIDSIQEGKIRSKYGKEIDPCSLYSRYKYSDECKKKKRLSELDDLISIVHVNEQKLLYRTVNDGLTVSSCLPTWKKIKEWGEENFEEWRANVFSIWYDLVSISPNNSIRQDIAIRIPNTMKVDLPFMTQRIDAGYYLTGILAGSVSELINANRDIHTFWLAERGFVPEKTPYYLHYLNDYKQDGFYKVRFYIKAHSAIVKRS